MTDAHARLLAAAQAIYPALAGCDQIPAEEQQELEEAILESQRDSKVSVINPRDVEDVVGGMEGVVLLYRDGRSLAINPLVVAQIERAHLGPKARVVRL